MATIRKARLKISRNVEVDVAGAVKAYRVNGAMLMRVANRREQNSATEVAVAERTRGQQQIELALALVGQEALVARMREEREVVEKIYRRKLANLDHTSLLTRRERRRRIVDGMAAEADIELAH